MLYYLKGLLENLLLYAAVGGACWLFLLFISAVLAA